MTDVAGKRVIVTGAARGLGLAFASDLADAGARVLGADVLPAPEALAEHGIEVVPTDVTSAQDVEALAAAANDTLGGLDALVNNAALVSVPRRPFWEIPDEEWSRVFDVNVRGVWLCAKALLPLLRESGGGAIVNLASETAFSGSTGITHYAASKGAVVTLTRALARELGPDRIRVNAIAPGFIPTEASRTMRSDAYDATATALGRVGEPDDLLGTLRFLVSDESAFVTGQTLLVNGGRLMR